MQGKLAGMESIRWSKTRFFAWTSYSRPRFQGSGLCITNCPFGATSVTPLAASFSASRCHPLPLKRCKWGSSSGSTPLDPFLSVEQGFKSGLDLLKPDPDPEKFENRIQIGIQRNLKNGLDPKKFTNRIQAKMLDLTGSQSGFGSATLLLCYI